MLEGGAMTQEDRVQMRGHSVRLCVTDPTLADAATVVVRSVGFSKTP